LKHDASRAYTADMTDKLDDKLEPPATRLSSRGLRMPANFREVPGVPFAIIGAEHLRGAFKALAPSPAPSPAPPERE
jgi:hypothetical protein